MPRELTDPSVPQWLREMGEQMQKGEADKEYENAKANFENAKRDWTVNAQWAVDNNTPISAFSKSIPVRTVFKVDDLQPVLVETKAPVDPSLTLPKIPTKTATLPPTGFTTSDPTAILQRQLAKVLSEISRLRADMHLKP